MRVSGRLAMIPLHYGVLAPLAANLARHSIMAMDGK
jgi:hypothetical protein